MITTYFINEILTVAILSIFYDFSVEFWNCSDSVVFLFVFHFIPINTFLQLLIKYIFLLVKQICVLFEKKKLFRVEYF